MQVCWVISESTPSDLYVPMNIATSWGSWKTHMSYNTENCVCANTSEAKHLTNRDFQKTCNLYIMQDSHAVMGDTTGVKLFAGKFGSTNISNKDDIVALNLAVPQYDLVLLFGFNLSPTTSKARDEYYFNVTEIIRANPTTQFVLVDYAHELISEIAELPNVTEDTVDSVTSLLG